MFLCFAVFCFCFKTRTFFAPLRKSFYFFYISHAPISGWFHIELCVWTWSRFSWSGKSYNSFIIVNRFVSVSRHLNDNFRNLLAWATTIMCFYRSFSAKYLKHISEKTSLHFFWDTKLTRLRCRIRIIPIVLPFRDSELLCKLTRKRVHFQLPKLIRNYQITGTVNISS